MAESPSRRRKILQIALFLTLLPLPAAAEHVQTCEGHAYPVEDGQQIICSATWRFEATCKGAADMWADWKVSGRTEPALPFVQPWLDVPIRVVGYDLLKLARPAIDWPWNLYFNSTYSWFMVGSSIQPDGFVSIGPGETHSTLIWPVGMGQIWPSKQAANPIVPIDGGRAYSGDLLDLHGVCFGRGRVSVLLTVYYNPLR